MLHWSPQLLQDNDFGFCQKITYAQPQECAVFVSCQTVYAVTAKSIGKQGMPDAGLVEAVLAVLGTCLSMLD